MNFSDHVESTLLCTQASTSYSLPGKLLTKCCIINNKTTKGHVVNVEFISSDKFKIYDKTQFMRGPITMSVSWCQHIHFMIRFL